MEEYRSKDIIEITQKQLDLIMKWRDMNKDIVRKFLPFISNGILRIKQENCANEISFIIIPNEENAYSGIFDYFVINKEGKKHYVFMSAFSIRDGKVYIKTKS